MGNKKKRVTVLALLVSVFTAFPVQAHNASANMRFQYIIPVSSNTGDMIRLLLKEFPYREAIQYPEARRRIVASALSAIGRVPYFWGGKYAPNGSYPEWGEPSKVYSKGNNTTGMVLPYGLDCSGFVQWAFYDALGEDAGIGIGISTMSQWDASYGIRFEDAVPGDLLFRSEPGNGTNHVGIVVGRNQHEEVFVIHCTSSVSGVCISKAKDAGFTMARRVKNVS